MAPLRAWRSLRGDTITSKRRAQRPGVDRDADWQFFFEADDGAILTQDRLGQLVTALPPRSRPYSERRVRATLSKPRGTEPRRKVVRTELGYGQYFPRIWRGETDAVAFDNAAAEPIVLAIQSARLIFDWMTRVFQVVQPTKRNFRSFGLEMRQLLIAACTDVESNWKAILKAHGVAPTGRDHGTRDYVKLLGPLRLGEWEVAMPAHFAIGGIRPFATWSPDRPSASLRWYDAYNAAKHDREENLASANLEAVIHAVAAVYVMLLAQVGARFFGEGPFRVQQFTVTASPRWRPEEWYGPAPVWKRDLAPGAARHNPPGWSRAEPVWTPVRRTF